MSTIVSNVQVSQGQQTPLQVREATKCKGIKRERYLAPLSAESAQRLRREIFKSEESAVTESEEQTNQEHEQAPLENEECKGVKRKREIAPLSESAKCSRGTLKPEDSEVKEATITCIDEAIDTGDVKILQAWLETGLSPNGCGGPNICCGGSHPGNLVRRSGKGPGWKPNDDPMSFVDKVESPQYLRMLMMLIAHGADLNKQAYRGPMNADRGTAAHYVQSPIALYILMVAGADMNATIGLNGKLVGVQKYLEWTGRSRIWACAHKAFLARSDK